MQHQNNTRPAAGQRWVSDSEPELGLGVILGATPSRVEILFAATGERRLYALSSAPLRRVIFREGDTIRTGDDREFVVESVVEEKGLVTYQAGDEAIPEGELSDTISFSAPEERLLAGSIDPIETFDLRAEALRVAGEIAASPVRGFVGGRIDLIPHQLSIAAEVAGRLAPRVLLADEVGLGKTIEAGLILHRLHHTGRADRILILLPESLIHQWFVELYRRFNLHFSIIDRERFEEIEEEEPDGNPFLDAQHILCSVDLLVEDPERAARALEAGWDLLVVDEAHHLAWSPDQSSPEYDLIASFAAQTAGLLLLTATPQQLGPEGHFARLRLLDPDRYSDLDAFVAEGDRYEKVADIIDRLDEDKDLTTEDLGFIAEQSTAIAERAGSIGSDDENAEEQRDRLVEDLLDSFGTGRVMFRNRRAAIVGFPERAPQLAPLDGDDPFAAKLAWLIGMIRDHRDKKILLICSSRDLAEEIEISLRESIEIDAALFHEDLPLVRRDKNAAWFADPEGAQMLISSEIGSEGRNFQFAHHLVLFDLPSNPELLEQRIGRLDRIGQRETINIHVPYVKGADSEVLARWYDEGLGAFEKNVPGASEIAQSVGDDLAALLATFDEKRLDALVARSVEERAQVAGRLERGYDRLLERNSNRPGAAYEVARAIRAADNDRVFETFFLRLCDYFGVRVIELGKRKWVLKIGHLLTDEFPAIPEDGMIITFDRRRALEREDLQFFSLDHPFVRDVLDLFLESEQGNATLAVRKGSDGPQLMLEMLVVAETIAPNSLDVQRYLPPRPLRIVIDGDGVDQSEEITFRGETLLDGSRLGRLAALQNAGMLRDHVPTMIDAAQKAAEEQLATIVEDATASLDTATDRELDRLRHLAAINDHVSEAEITDRQQHRDTQAKAIAQARVRVVALRFVEQEG